jgi:hypothetical protein
LVPLGIGVKDGKESCSRSEAIEAFDGSSHHRSIWIACYWRKPIIEATPAFAQSNQVHKIAICDQRGYPCINSLGIAKLNK